MMQAIGRRYAGVFNTRYRRTGSRWEGRFKSAPVGGDTCLLTRYRDIGLDPSPAAIDGGATGVTRCANRRPG